MIYKILSLNLALPLTFLMLTLTLTLTLIIAAINLIKTQQSAEFEVVLFVHEY